MSDVLPAKDVTAAARGSGLRYLGDDAPGIKRRKRGGGFSYVDENGKRLDDAQTLKRIRRLAIPPAWTDVWISPVANGHLQATGRDARGRKQYRYHQDFRAAREQTKFEHIVEFGRALKRIRRRVNADMAKPGLSRQKVIATVVHLLDITLIRVGNAEYERTNKSYGLTTLLNRHVNVRGDKLGFEFTGKGGKRWRLTVRDRRVARVVRSCQDLPGQHLFQYVDEDGETQTIGSTDVNGYLHEATGAEVTAKDFRTFTGSVLAARALLSLRPPESQVEAKANVREAVEAVARRLGNTPAICRKCYIHPAIIDAYLEGALALPRRGEEGVLSFLRARAATRGRQRAPRRKQARSGHGGSLAISP